MFDHGWKRELLTIPNMLSLFRLLLIPVYIHMYLKADNSLDYYWAGTVLGISCLTDLIDGKIAREFNMISNTGKVLDPLADKMTQLALILSLLREHRIFREGLCNTPRFPILVTIRTFSVFHVRKHSYISSPKPRKKAVALIDTHPYQPSFYMFFIFEFTRRKQQLIKSLLHDIVCIRFVPCMTACNSVHHIQIFSYDSFVLYSVHKFTTHPSYLLKGLSLS